MPSISRKKKKEKPDPTLGTKQDRQIRELEETAEKLNISVKYEKLKGVSGRLLGGLCKIKGEYRIIIHSSAEKREKIEILKKALRQLDLEDVFLLPAVRKLIYNGDK